MSISMERFASEGQFATYNPFPASMHHVSVFQIQSVMSSGSFEPPPVKIVAFSAPSSVQLTAPDPVVSKLVEQSLPTTW